MTTLETKTFGTSQKFAVTVELRAAGQGFEVIRRRQVRGSRAVVLLRAATESEGREKFASTCALASYWAGSISERYAQRVEAGDFVTVKV